MIEALEDEIRSTINPEMLDKNRGDIVEWN
jgi:hypothetical protein